MLIEYSDVGMIFLCLKVFDFDQFDVYVVVIGVLIGWFYSVEVLDCDQVNVFDVIRVVLGWFQFMDEWFDFDVGGMVFDGREIKVVDCGNVIVDCEDLVGILVCIENVICKILNVGVVLIVFGGDYLILILVFKVYFGYDGQLMIIQIDVYIDWCDEVYGVMDGYFSLMCCVLEMVYVGEMFQIGICG